MASKHGSRSNGSQFGEKQVRDILDHRFAVTPAMIHSIDPEGYIVAVSDAWLGKLGYNRDEVIGRKSSDFLTPESRERAINTIIPAFFKDGRCENIQYQMITKSGQILDVLFSAVLEIDALKETSSSICVITDITTLKATKRRLAESERHYRKIIEDQTEIVSLATLSGEILFANSAYARLYGRQPADVIGRNLYEFVPPAQHEAVASHFETLLKSGESLQQTNQVTSASGQTRWIEWTNRALKDSSGQTAVIHSVGRDVQERVSIEHRLKESEARYRTLAEYSSDMVFQLDRTLVRTYVSPSCREILGYEPEDMTGIPPVSMVHPDDGERVSGIFKDVLEGRLEQAAVVNRIRHRDGKWIWVEAKIRALQSPDTHIASGIIGSLRDISIRKEVEAQLSSANRKLRILANEDGLTGLANRRAFDIALVRALKKTVSEKRALSLIMIDVDCFKAFNDRYGHPAGDECLKQISKALERCILRPHDVVARYGGEEFIILLPDTNISGATVIAERMRSAVLSLAIEHTLGPEGVVSISAGLTTSNENSVHDIDMLLVEADQALYHAKTSGRNMVVHAKGVLPGGTPAAPSTLLHAS